jgi:type IV pilus assembly protein PilB
MRYKKRLGDMLWDRGLVDSLQLRAALGFHNKWGVPLGQVVADMGFCKPEQVLAVLAQQLGLGTVALDQEPVDAGLAERVPVRLAEACRVVPLRVEGPRGSVLVVASVAPASPEALDRVASLTGYARVVPLLATDAAIRRAIDRLYYPHLLEAQRPVEPIALPEADEHLPLERDRAVYLATLGYAGPGRRRITLVEKDGLPLMRPLTLSAMPAVERTATVTELPLMRPLTVHAMPAVGGELPADVRPTVLEMPAVEPEPEPEVLVYGWGAQAAADLVKRLEAEGLRVRVASTEQVQLADERTVVVAPLQSVGWVERRGLRAQLLVAGRLPEVDLPLAEVVGARAFVGSPLKMPELVAAVHELLRAARVPARRAS